MRYPGTFLLAALVMTRGLSAQVPSVVADVDSVAGRELVALEYHLSDLLNRGDWQAYAPYLAEDYRQTTRRGEVRTKADVISALRRRDERPGEVVVPDSVQVRIYGNTGVLTAVLTGRRTAGDAVTFRSRILKVFVRRDGRWYMVGMQGTPLS
jgi:hypothetical protein